MAEEKTTIKEKKEDILKEARERLNLALEADEENREKQINALNFLNGDQWHEADKKNRENRPCLVIDRLSGHVDVVAGEQRMNKPSIKVHPVDNIADPDTADVIGGMIRNIEFTSFASRAYTNAYESTLQCGKGAFRVLIQFIDDKTFDQEILIEEIDNIFSVQIDPYCKGNMEKANWAVITDRITREEYKRKYPDKEEALSVKEATGDLSGWADDKSIKIAEYFRKKEIGKKTLYQTIEGKDTFDKPPDNKIAKNSSGKPKQREVTEYQIEWFKISGNDILEGPVEWAGKYIPIILVWGKKINIGEKTIVRGLIDKAIDAQRLYNYFRSTMAEVTALQPKAPFMLSENQIEGHEAEWNTIDDAPKPYIVFKSDPNLSGQKPERSAPPVRSSGLEAEVQFSADEIKDTTTLQDASLGVKSNEKSGIAIEKRQQIGGITTYAFVDNLVSSITYAGKVIIDLIPKIYNKARIVRTLGLDETEDHVSINSAVDLRTNIKLEKAFNLNIGKYDLTVTAGPSFSTQRQEAREFLLQYIKEDPESVPFIRHVVMKYQDVPGASEIVDIFKKIAPPGVLEEKGEEGGEEAMMPPEGMAEEMMGEGTEQPEESEQASEVEILKLENEKIKQQTLLIDRAIKAYEAKNKGVENTGNELVDQFLSQDIE